MQSERTYKSIAISMRAVSSKSSDHFLESIVIDTKKERLNSFLIIWNWE